MKNLYLILSVILCLLFIDVESIAQTSIAVNISQTDTIVRTCANNRYSATFNLGTIPRHVSINAFLNSTASFVCSNLPTEGIYIDSVQITGTGASVTNGTMYFPSGTWSGDINTNNHPCTLTYIIHLDCSMIPNTPNNHTFTLQQLWFDTGHNLYNINNSNDSLFKNFDVEYPYINDQSPNSLPSSLGYLQQKDLPFSYSNNSSTDANMIFNFTPASDTSSCDINAIHTLSLKYRIGVAGTIDTLVSGADVHILLPHDSTLYIIQKVQGLKCIGGCSRTANFNWHCFNSTTIDSSFCHHCQNNYTTTYNIGNLPDSGLFIQRVTPVSIDNYACANNIGNLVQYEYNVVNHSDAALDTAFFDILSSVDPAYLTLIPKNSIHIDTTKCVSCHIVEMDTILSTGSLCSSAITQPVYKFKIIAHNFAKGDTINVRFATYRCVQDTSILFNTAKFYEHIGFDSTRVVNICNSQNGGLNFPSNQIYSANGITSRILDDINLLVNFTPTIADLSSQSNAFGDSAAFEVEMKGFDSNFDDELFGSSSIRKGYLRVTVDCDKGLRIQSPLNDAYFRYDSAGTIKRLYPLYFNSTKDSSNICDTGKYYFYYNLSNPAMNIILNKGFFDYELQSCCAGQNGKRYFNIDFHTQLNPSGSCDTLNFTIANPNWLTPPTCSTIGSGTGCNSWLPLSQIKGGITIHCPGCVTPGMIISSYQMNRTSFGLQDSNNDGKADDSLIRITKNSAWYAANSVNLKLHFSSLGDKLEDQLVSHFEPGDASAGANGYTYVQMLADGVQLPYLQLARKIPAGIDTMKVTPDSFYVYIDKPVTGSANCIDCSNFGVNPTKFKTQKILKVSGVSMANYLSMDAAYEFYLYTFESKDSAGSWVGNLHYPNSATLNTYNDPTDTLQGFFEGQQYRIRVFYSSCGDFFTTNNTLPQISDIRIQSDITNAMWMSGKPQVDLAVSNVPGQPGNISALNSSGYTIIPNGVDTVINAYFASSHIFNCENFDGIHYFFSTNVTNDDWRQGIGSDSGCSKTINIVSTSSIADNLQNVYPYEYRPGSLQPDTITVNVPAHYKIDSAFVFVSLPINGVDSTSLPKKFTPPSMTGKVVIPSSSLPTKHCLKQSNTISNDTLLYFGDKYTQEFLKFYISPNRCDSTRFQINDTTFIVNYGTPSDTCIPAVTCSNSINKNMVMPNQLQKYRELPNDTITFVNTLNNAIENTISLQIKSSNFPIIIDSIITSDAPFFFIALPDTIAMPYFNNWRLVNGSNTIHAIGQIIRVDSLFKASSSVRIDTLYADYKRCIPQNLTSIKLPFYYGWNCTGFPISPFNPSSVCGVKSDTLIIINKNAAISAVLPSCHPSTYDLCAPFTITNCFYSNANGGVYPKSITFGGLPNGLLLDTVSLVKNCNIPTLTSGLQYNSQTHSYPIGNSNLAALGISNGVLKTDSSICVRATYTATCGLNSFNSPSVKLSAISFCGDTLSTTDSTARLASVSLTKMNSFCDSCFTITKTANTNNVFVGDTVTYTITITSNNSQFFFNPSHNFSDALPVGFHVISPNPMPTSVTLQPNGSITFHVTGYYTTDGTCSNSSFFNTATLTTVNSKTVSDTACINVAPACLQLADTIIANNGRSDAYFPSGFAQNKKIFIQGNFYITQYLTLTNCTVWVAPGGKIINVSSEPFTLDSTTITGCQAMWAGVDMSTTTTLNKIYLKNHSAINDAAVAIKAGRTSVISCLNSSIEDNIRGIYYPDISLTGNQYHISPVVNGCKFGMKSSQLKPPYLNQSFYGSTPYSGIEMYDHVSAVIGDLTGYSPNYFNRLCFGIKGTESTILVSNVTMNSIIRSSGYPNSAAMAISNVGTQPLGIRGSLTVNNGIGAVTISNCEDGIYTKYSNLDANYCTINYAWHGIESRQCIDWLHTNVTSCNITARKFGIDWVNNHGASQMYAGGNTIHVLNSSDTTVAGILCQEIISGGGNGNYIISDVNNITVGSNGYGIWLMNVIRSQVNRNHIYQTGGISANSKGICIDGNAGGYVSCNFLYGDSTQLNTIGINTRLSDNIQLICNNVAKTYTGLYFGGGCGGTDIRGNVMANNYLGMYLNNVSSTGGVIDTLAVTGQQNQTGNMWVGYRGLIGALNSNYGNEYLSEFDVNTTMGQKMGSVEYFPFLNNTNAANGWFVQQSGTPYNCQSSSACSYPSPVILSNDYSSYERAIATDSITTEIYNEETRYLSQEYLYNYLENNPAAINSNFDFNNFFIEHQNDNIGDLYNVEQDLASNGLFFSNTINLVKTTDSLMAIYEDSLRNVYNYGFADPSDANERIYQSWKVLNGTRISLIANQHAYTSSFIDDAWALNSAIIPIGVPEANRQTMNDISTRYVQYGMDSVISSYDYALAIANQCIYSGGKAVIQARVFVMSINDTIEFDDDALCLTDGIFRIMKEETKKTQTAQKVIIQPNPASEIVHVSLLNKEDGICEITIYNNLGVEVLKKKMDCKEAQINLDIKNLASGLYYVKINNQSSWNFVEKLVITR